MLFSTEVEDIKGLKEEIKRVLERLPTNTDDGEEVNIAKTFLSKADKNLYGAISHLEEAENLDDWGGE